MTQDSPLVDLERELLDAASRRAASGRRFRPSVLLVAALIVLVAVAVPALAGGLVAKLLPQSPHVRPIGNEQGPNVVLNPARGARRSPYLVIAYNGTVPAYDRRKRALELPGVCVRLELRRPPQTRRAVDRTLAVDCRTEGQLGPRLPVTYNGSKLFRPRAIYTTLLPAQVTRVRASFLSGRHLDITPNGPPARSAGLRFAFRYVAFVAPAGDRFRGIIALDGKGREVGRFRLPTPATGPVNTVTSPALPSP